MKSIGKDENEPFAKERKKARKKPPRRGAAKVCLKRFLGRFYFKKKTKSKTASVATLNLEILEGCFSAGFWGEFKRGW